MRNLERMGEIVVDFPNRRWKYRPEVNSLTLSTSHNNRLG